MMSAAQAAEPDDCPPPLATDSGELAGEADTCAAHAETLADWVRDLQALILGDGAPP